MRCQHDVIDKKTGRTRKCKKVATTDNMCTFHFVLKQKTDELNKKIFVAPDDNSNHEYNKCCFCGCDCNPLSQSCGVCARQQTMRSIGWI
jgi:hypothetical protein